MSQSNNSTKGLVLLFGANGFLGSSICEKLVDSDISVIAVMRPGSDNSRLNSIKNIKVIESEISKWPDLIAHLSPETVVCAQWNGVAMELRENEELQISNIQPIVNLAISARNNSVKTFVTFGSQAESTLSSGYIFEERLSSSESVYGSVKRQLLEELLGIFKNSSTRFLWARVFSVYGPRENANSILWQLFLAEKQQTQVDLRNPSMFWSYLYIDDFANAIEKIIVEKKVSGIINIGSPNFYEISDIVAIWHGESSSEINNFVISESNIGYFPVLEKLISIGWKPFTSLAVGLKKTRIDFEERFTSK